MKLLLILPTKWKSLDKRVEDLSKYLSRKDRLGSIYGEVKITYVIQPLPDLKLNYFGVYNTEDILSITKSFHPVYDAVGVVFPFVKGEKYFGNYYPNDSKEHKMDFYIKSNENNSIREELEDMVEHELAHAVALDLGLTGQNNNTGYVAGADNTHYYFYNRKIPEYYKEINQAWTKKFGLLTKMIETTSKLLGAMLKKKL